MGDDPLRELSRAEVEAYDRDGVVCAQGLFGADWIERMARAVDWIVAHPTYYGGQVSIDARGFSGDLFVWKLDDDFRDFVYESPGAPLFPQILPHPIPQEGARRAQGPEPPDPSSMSSVLEGVRTYMEGRTPRARA